MTPTRRLGLSLRLKQLDFMLFSACHLEVDDGHARLEAESRLSVVSAARCVLLRGVGDTSERRLLRPGAERYAGQLRVFRQQR